MGKGKELAVSVSASIEGKLRAKVAMMKEKIQNLRDQKINLEVKVDILKEDMKEIKMENAYLRSIVGPDH